MYFHGLITHFFSVQFIYHSLFIHSPTEGHFGCFQALAITHKAAVNTHMQVLCAFDMIFIIKYWFFSSRIRMESITHFVPLCVWLLLLSIVFFSFIHESIVHISSLFFSVINIPLYEYVKYIQLVYLFSYF